MFILGLYPSPCYFCIFTWWLLGQETRNRDESYEHTHIQDTGLHIEINPGKDEHQCKLAPWWVGSTIRNLTIWATLNSHERGVTLENDLHVVVKFSFNFQYFSVDILVWTVKNELTKQLIFISVQIKLLATVFLRFSYFYALRSHEVLQKILLWRCKAWFNNLLPYTLYIWFHKHTVFLHASYLVRLTESVAVKDFGDDSGERLNAQSISIDCRIGKPLICGVILICPELSKGLLPNFSHLHVF